jgi:hypothetical protein
MSTEVKKTITRKEFMRGGAAALGAGVLTGCVAPAAAPQIVKETVEVPVEKIVEVPAAAGACGPVVLQVYDPYGPAEVTQLFAPRLDTLEGKTIAYAEGTWMVGTAKPLVLELLQAQYPTVKIVDIPLYTDIMAMTDAQVADMLKEKGVDAVIVGNAG